MSDDDVMGRALVLLEGLGGTEPQVRESLTVFAPLVVPPGTPQLRGCRCPLAVFLTSRLGRQFGVGSDMFGPYGEWPWLPLPPACAAFVDRYDWRRDYDPAYAALIPVAAS
jgi:hypothetical protein